MRVVDTRHFVPVAALLAAFGLGNAIIPQFSSNEAMPNQARQDTASMQAVAGQRSPSKQEIHSAKVWFAKAESNLLWTTPLSELTATRERPIFSSERRVSPVFGPAMGDSPERPATDRPRLTLMGTISGADDIAIFLDESTKITVRLRTGESHLGWMLQAVKGREATLQKDRETALMVIPTLAAKQN